MIEKRRQFFLARELGCVRYRRALGERVEDDGHRHSGVFRADLAAAHVGPGRQVFPPIELHKTSTLAPEV